MTFFLRAAVAVKVQASDARVAGYSTTSANYFFLPAFFAGARLRQSQNVLNFTELRAQFPALAPIAHPHNLMTVSNPGVGVVLVPVHDLERRAIIVRRSKTREVIPGYSSSDPSQWIHY